MKHAVYFRAPGTDSWIKATKTFDDVTVAVTFASAGVYEHRLGDAYRIEHEGPKAIDMKAFMREAIILAREIQSTHRVNDRYPPERRLRASADEFLRQFASYPERFP